MARRGESSSAAEEAFLHAKDDLEQGMQSVVVCLQRLQTKCKAMLYMMTSSNVDCLQLLESMLEEVNILRRKVEEVGKECQCNIITMDKEMKLFPQRQQALEEKHAHVELKADLTVSYGICKVAGPVHTKIRVLKQVQDQKRYLRSLYRELSEGDQRYKNIIRQIEAKVAAEMDDEAL